MRDSKGFTLIELVIVLILIGIVSAVAIPKFLDFQDEAKKNAVKGSLASVRSAINIYYANAAIKNKPNKFPNLTTLRAIFNGPIPPNPLNNNNKIERTTSANPPTPATGFGWRYNPNTGQFWSAVSGGIGANAF